MKRRLDETATLALRIDRLMRRIHADLHPRAREFDRHNVGPLGGMLLLAVSEREPVDIQTVVEALGRDKSQISRLIRRLENKGLVTREPSRDDGRVSMLRLTDDGRKQLTLIKGVLTSVVDRLFQPLSTDERAAFSDVLERVLIEPTNQTALKKDGLE